MDCDLPHSPCDFAETVARAACRTVLRGSSKRFKFLSDAHHAQSTHHEPAKSLYAALPDVPAVSVDIAMGFPPVDIPDCGPCVVAYATTQTQAEEDVETLTRQFIAAEPEFDAKLMSAAAAVEKATNLPGPVIIADPQDNPGAGGIRHTGIRGFGLCKSSIIWDCFLIPYPQPKPMKQAESRSQFPPEAHTDNILNLFLQGFVVAITDGIFRRTVRCLPVILLTLEKWRALGSKIRGSKSL